MTAPPGAAEAYAAVAAVADPELPVLTIADLGVLRDVRVDGDRVEVDLTPTYSGCPAMDAIRADVETALRGLGVAEPVVRVVLSPAWSTDWLSDEARRKLHAYGVAPPPPAPRPGEPVPVPLSVRCPHCGSPDTGEVSRFGSTACKALWRCSACREPFDHVKAL